MVQGLSHVCCQTKVPLAEAIGESHWRKPAWRKPLAEATLAKAIGESHWRKLPWRKPLAKATLAKATLAKATLAKATLAKAIGESQYTYITVQFHLHLLYFGTVPIATTDILRYNAYYTYLPYHGPGLITRVLPN